MKHSASRKRRWWFDSGKSQGRLVLKGRRVPDDTDGAFDPERAMSFCDRREEERVSERTVLVCFEPKSTRP